MPLHALSDEVSNDTFLRDLQGFALLQEYMGHLRLGDILQLDGEQVLKYLSPGAKMDFLLLSQLVLCPLQRRTATEPILDPPTATKRRPRVLHGLVDEQVAVAYGRGSVVGKRFDSRREDLIPMGFDEYVTTETLKNLLGSAAMAKVLRFSSSIQLSKAMEKKCGLNGTDMDPSHSFVELQDESEASFFAAAEEDSVQPAARVNTTVVATPAEEDSDDDFTLGLQRNLGIIRMPNDPYRANQKRAAVPSDLDRKKKDPRASMAHDEPARHKTRPIFVDEDASDEGGEPFQEGDRFLPGCPARTPELMRGVREVTERPDYAREFWKLNEEVMPLLRTCVGLRVSFAPPLVVIQKRDIPMGLRWNVTFNGVSVTLSGRYAEVEHSDDWPPLVVDDAQPEVAELAKELEGMSMAHVALYMAPTSIVSQRPTPIVHHFKIQFPWKPLLALRHKTETESLLHEPFNSTNKPTPVPTVWTSYYFKAQAEETPVDIVI